MRTALRAACVAAAAAVAALTTAGPAFAAPARAPSRDPLVHVVVSGTTGSQQRVEQAVERLGGTVSEPLGVIAGVSASVPTSALPALRASAGVRAVTLDAKGTLQSVDPVLGYDVAGDDGSLYDVAQVTHAKDAWAKGFTGKGVGVALIDSGVAPVKGLTSGNVVQGPDLSFESQNPDLLHKDTFGHGTHMGSIIAGRDVALIGPVYANAGTHTYNGVAPDATLISLKVAAADGGCDVSQVIAAIDWVAQHAKDPNLNIKVLNLSYGTDSTQDPSIDPLDYAVENAWRAGLTVVVSSGNDGTSRAALADPANDPLVLAVGADDPNGTDPVGDDKVPDFAQRGTSARHVDVIAPGVHVLGLRNPGSEVDQANPSAVVGGRFFRGSGTSQAAAVVSGLSALYLQKYPSATPDQVKKALMQSATAPSSVKSVFSGVGVPDVNKAIGAPLPSTSTSAQASTGATGQGSLDAARGSSRVSDDGVELVGETDIFGQPWDSSSWGAQSAQHTAWTGGTWLGEAMTGDNWAADGAWASRAWLGNDWASRAWLSRDWLAHSWTDAGWDSRAWLDSSWQASSWTASAWSGSSWSSSAWTSSAWN